MSAHRTMVVLLDEQRALATTAGDALRALPYAGDPNALVDHLRQETPSGTRQIVLVIGGAWLDCANVVMPSMSLAERRRAISFQADRFFASAVPLALAFSGDLALAAPAAWVTEVRSAFASWLPVVAVTTLPQAAALAGLSGRWETPAGSNEHLVMTLANGTVADARRIRARGTVDGASDCPPDITQHATRHAIGAAAAARALSVPEVLRDLAQRTDEGLAWTADRQLLDVAADRALVGAARRAWWRAGALLAASLAVLAWGADRWREHTRTAWQDEVARRQAEAAPAMAALDRLQRAADEVQQITAADQPATRDAAPSHVIARLGSLLPVTAFVQHLEWNGQEWRIDGSAIDAAALVPRLDADPAIDAVHSLAPSTRFLDGSTPRSSFSIGFRWPRQTTRDAGASPAADTGVAHGR